MYLYHVDQSSFIPAIKELVTATVTPEETGQLVKYWINWLTREKTKYIQLLVPTPYDLLPYKAKLSIALRQIEEQQALDLEYKIAFNNLVQSHTKTRRQRYLERITNPNPNTTPVHIVPNYLANTSTTTVPSTDNKVDNNQLESNEDFLDYDLDNPSLQVSSQQPHVPANGTASLTSNIVAQVQAAANSTSDLAARVKAMTLPQIQRVDPPKETASAMDIDKSPPLLGATPLPLKFYKDNDLVITTHPEILNNEISLLSKEDKIQVMVKEHVAIHARFLQAQKDRNNSNMKTLFFKAQENQKSLQKLIPNWEIESYVKGWNSWEVKQTLFPPQAKREREGKPKLSLYNNQDTWAEVADIASAVRSLYKTTKQG
ncbi:hypothetical protein PCASD_26719 [Puccinia coronata f. sp. avenae]|uniref:Uncharacterized protein n=1 Tax=Puccinia coronata f. sp. avenae TaxID=200324 RepID=A0A2N5TLN4_9BASI|nr:hypothetical protein PCASD_26719 [Puccinia coronata f. sp. avenae]